MSILADLYILYLNEMVPYLSLDQLVIKSSEDLFQMMVSSGLGLGAAGCCGIFDNS